ncbi:Clp protease ClpB [Bacillus pumilus]|uniref:Clp protease ClpB n=1 Tax=Bacillus pumilus TaxID=1408 RepID=A0AAE3WLW7_BACPU|nr:Clp protease ClpB [Bacillus pumilus]MDF9458064.1 Clp protease ClpB [Bacillus pumilus]MDF9458105.1 Clp protease ClpB [Bacillus pumilus]MDR4250715.1 Clp protease ClpB [Bacillus pumilus]
MFVKRFMPLFDADDQAGGGQTEEQTPTQPNDDQPKKLELTQEELDALITKRISRVESKYADYGDLKEKVSAYEKAEQEKADAELTELERIKKELEAKSETEMSLAKQIEDLKKADEQNKITNEFIKIATAHGIAYVDDALRLADLSEVKVDEGKVLGIEGVVREIVDNKPYLIKSTQNSKPIGQPTNGGGESGGEIKTLEAQLTTAKKEKNFSKVVEISNKIKSLLNN